MKVWIVSVTQGLNEKIIADGIEFSENYKRTCKNTQDIVNTARYSSNYFSWFISVTNIKYVEL